MTVVGYHRYKIASVSANGNTLIFNNGTNVLKTITVVPINLEDGKKVLKYLNRDGKYCLFPFSKYYEDLDQPKEIGKVNNFVTSILNSLSDTKSIGYKSDRILNLISEPIDENQLSYLKDIYTSPRVYLYIGTGLDTEYDWLLVTVKADKSVRKQPKVKFTTISLEVTLPETYTISML